MMLKKIVFVVFFITNFVQANITLPAMFADHMVLQQQDNVQLWGWATPNEEITVTTRWNHETFTAKTNSYAHWSVSFSTPKAGGPYTITIKGYNTIELQDVLIGEVWLCSGQSNMEWSANSGIEKAEEAIRNAHFPEIRFFSVTNRSADYPQLDVDGQWNACTPETMQYFSAIAYFFGKELFEKMDVPIGLIDATWGGTPAEIWMPKEVIETNNELKKASTLLQPAPWGPHEPGKAYNAMIAPLTNFRIAGAIWYQGESNINNASHYKHILSNLIRSWRQKWNLDFSFYFVQIAPYDKYEEPLAAAIVRDQQRRVLDVANTGMVVIDDIGNVQDIHPRNKHDVGKRLAKLALKHHYNKINGIVESPLFKKFRVEKKKGIVQFYNADGLHFNGDKNSLFELAGKDKMYYKAKAEIKNDQVILSSKKVKKPVYVRYAWRNDAISNVFNNAQLPASCFTNEN